MMKQSLFKFFIPNLRYLNEKNKSQERNVLYSESQHHFKFISAKKRSVSFKNIKSFLSKRERKKLVIGAKSQSFDSITALESEAIVKANIHTIS